MKKINFNKLQNLVGYAALPSALLLSASQLQAQTAYDETQDAAIATNAVRSINNASDILTLAAGGNVSAVATNSANIVTNASNIVINASDITANDTDISANSAQIASNTANIAVNSSSIVSNDNDIATNDSAIAVNSASIVSNDNDIATNDSAIAVNSASIASNDTDISVNSSQIASNTANIANNWSAIANTTSDIYYIYADIETNATDIAVNSFSIVSNDNDIATNDTAIAALNDTVFSTELEEGEVGLAGVITKKANGDIHIGENSLITNETGGVQLLFAQDALGAAIDINITNGSDLLINGISVATDVDVDALRLDLQASQTVQYAALQARQDAQDAQIAILSSIGTLSTTVPSDINYQGRLIDADGNPASGIKNFTITLYDAAADGNELYSESIDSVVIDTNGIYNFQFGENGSSTASSTEILATTDGAGNTFDGLISFTPTNGSLSVTDGTYNWNIVDGNAGVQAVATIQIVNGFVVGFNIIEGGSGYTSVPTVSIVGDGSGATATASVVDGTVTSINVVTNGAGYATATASIDEPRIPFIVNYANQSFNITYDSIPAAGTEITANYDYLDGRISEAFQAGSGHWLELSIDGEIQSPRERILSVPFAITSAKAQENAALIQALQNQVEQLKQLTAPD